MSMRRRLQGGVGIVDSVSIPRLVVADEHGVFFTRFNAGASAFELRSGSGAVLAGGWIRSVAVDAQNVYWTDAGSIMKKPRKGGPATTVGKGQYSVVRWGEWDWTGFNPMAVDGDGIYWVTPNGKSERCLVMKTLLSGGESTVLALAAPIYGLSATDDDVYWTRDGGVDRVPKSGGVPTVVWEGDAGGIVTRGDAVYWTSRDAILGVRTKNDSPTVIASGQDQPGAITIAGDHLYWANRSSVMSLSLRGGPATRLVSYWSFWDHPGVQGLSATREALYWLYDGGGRGSGELVRFPLVP
jgi:hypothetical protein